MYLGRIVEIADKRTLYRTPQHPYTQALLAAVPLPHVRAPHVGAARRHVRLKGEVGSARDVPSGCRFHPRCPQAMDICREQDPPARDLGAGHLAACHLLS
jgi:oligopeptide transport system ATP-binding protein